MNANFLLAFDRICIISLPERHDRRDAVRRELRRLNLTIDGRRIRFFDAIRPAEAGDFPSVGARGCFLSHLQVLRDARADGVRRLLVLEDDVLFAPPTAASERLSGELVGDDWHLCYPGHARAAQPGSLRWIETRDPLLCAHCYGVRGSELDSVCAYLEACLTRPSGHPDGGPMHYDGALSLMRARQPRWRTWIASRSLVTQRSSRSDIAGPSWIDRVPMPGVATMARALRNGWRRVVAA